MIEDPYVLIRGGAVYVAALAIFASVLWRRPGREARVGALMAVAWNIPALFALHLAAIQFGWWRYDADGGLLTGFPIDVWLAWAVLWGAVPAIAFPRAPLIAIVLVAFAIDLVAMPAAAPVVRLGTHWLTGEIVALLLSLVPSQLLARWTEGDRHLVPRALLQVAAFAIFLVVLLPTIALEASASSWAIPHQGRWHFSIAMQLLAIPAVIGLTAVQEFVTRGNGTPVPFDPPRRLVTTGIYAYVANPMQLSAVLFLLMLAVIMRNGFVAVAAIMSHIYSVGLAGWDEEHDLRARFGDTWARYRARSRRWLPRWRPQHDDAARLYVASDCHKCRQVAAWFRARDARGLAIVPAEVFPVVLTRITYQSSDGTYATSGISAIARALEHIHFGWALLGFAIRLPIVSTIVQLVVDASGGGPRPAGVQDTCEAPRLVVHPTK